MFKLTGGLLDKQVANSLGGGASEFPWLLSLVEKLRKSLEGGSESGHWLPVAARARERILRMQTLYIKTNEIGESPKIQRMPY